MVRLDHNRALSQLADKTGAHNTDVKKMIIWGNHSSTQYPDIHHATVKGKAALSLVDQAWYEKEFIPTVQQRGAAVIKARGSSSAASAANAAIDHMRTWALGTDEGDWVSMGIPSDGSYGIAPGRDLRLSGHLQEWQIRHRAGTRNQCLLARAHGRHRQGTARGARRRGAPVFAKK